MSKEARLPGEGARDWSNVKDFFTRRAGELLVPPLRKLAIQSQRIDVQERGRPAKRAEGPPSTPRSRRKG